MILEQYPEDYKGNVEKRLNVRDVLAPACNQGFQITGGKAEGVTGMTASELDLQGRTTKAHIEKWQCYANKSRQHAISAATLVFMAEALLPRVEYNKWLSRHQIAVSTDSVSPSSRDQLVQFISKAPAPLVEKIYALVSPYIR